MIKSINSKINFGSLFSRHNRDLKKIGVLWIGEELREQGASLSEDDKKEMSDYLKRASISADTSIYNLGNYLNDARVTC